MKTRTRFANATLLLFASLCPSFSPAAANGYRLAHTFQAPVPAENDFFGTAVVLEGDIAAIKSHSGYLDGDGLSTTHFYSQQQGGWSLVDSFSWQSQRENVIGNLYHGQEIAIHNGEVFIGHNDDFRSGAFAPLFFASVSDSSLSVNQGITDIFGDSVYLRPGQRADGRSVDIGEDFAVVDAPGAPRGRFNSGRGVIRIYEKRADNFWHLAKNAFPADGRDFEPHSVAIDGTTVAVIEKGIADNPGGLLFFERQPNGEWLEEQAFLNVDTGTYLAQVELDGDTAIVRNLLSGELKAYERAADSWSETFVLTPSEASIELVGATSGLALEGDLFAHTKILSTGSDPIVEVYHRTSPGDWSMLASINNPSDGLGNAFGSSLAIDQGRLLIGGISVDANVASPPGVAYLFVPVPEPSSLLLLILTTGALLTRRRYVSSSALRADGGGPVR